MKTIVIVRMDEDGRLTSLHGQHVEMPHAREMDDCALCTAAQEDSDNPPLTEEQIASTMRRHSHATLTVRARSFSRLRAAYRSTLALISEILPI